MFQAEKTVKNYVSRFLANWSWKAPQAAVFASNLGSVSRPPFGDV
jgi:menaquinone-dependent protoporphyrinogen IX oxidase